MWVFFNFSQHSYRVEKISFLLSSCEVACLQQKKTKTAKQCDSMHIKFFVLFCFFLAVTFEILMVFKWHACLCSKVCLKHENPGSRSEFNDLSIKPRPYILLVTSEILRQQKNSCLIWHSCRLNRSCLISEEIFLLISIQVNWRTIFWTGTSISRLRHLFAFHLFWP